MCVASNGGYDKLKYSLDKTGLKVFFGEYFYSADQVSRGKPAPDLFLYAAKQMGFSAGQCVVVEDSPVGVKAAQAANMKVLHYLEEELLGEGLPSEAASKWYRQFSSMQELPALIAMYAQAIQSDCEYK